MNSFQKFLRFDKDSKRQKQKRAEQSRLGVTTVRCAICGDAHSTLYKRKLEPGYICVACMKKEKCNG